MHRQTPPHQQQQQKQQKRDTQLSCCVVYWICFSWGFFLMQFFFLVAKATGLSSAAKEAGGGGLENWGGGHTPGWEGGEGGSRAFQASPGLTTRGPRLTTARLAAAQSYGSAGEWGWGERDLGPIYTLATVAASPDRDSGCLATDSHLRPWQGPFCDRLTSKVTGEAGFA